MENFCLPIKEKTLTNSRWRKIIELCQFTPEEMEQFRGKPFGRVLEELDLMPEKEDVMAQTK
jgi:hypothetical protein